MTPFGVSYVLLWILVVGLLSAVFMLYRHEGRMLAGSAERHRVPGLPVGAVVSPTQHGTTEGTSVTLGRSEADLQAIVFMSAQCAHCPVRLPDVRSFAVSNNNVEVVVVVSGSLKEDLREKYLAQLTGAASLVIDTTLAIAPKFLVHRFPFVVMVGGAGKVLSVGPLADRKSFDRLLGSQSAQQESDTRATQGLF